MKLLLHEFAKCMKLTPDTVERWIRQGRIPVRYKDNHCVFNRLSLEKWAESNNLTFTMPGTTPAAKPENVMENLFPAMKRGGVFYDLEGDSVKGVLRAAVDRISYFQTGGRKDVLYKSLLAREELMSTGIGKGVAVPHPRSPLGYDDVPALITTCFLKTPVNFLAVDKQPVRVLFVLVCPSSKYHLHLLGRLSFCLRDEAFLKFLANTPDPSLFFEKIAEFDSRFDGPG